MNRNDVQTYSVGNAPYHDIRNKFETCSHILQSKGTFKTILNINLHYY
jgi:hypothetical protein